MLQRILLHWSQSVMSCQQWLCKLLDNSLFILINQFNEKLTLPQSVGYMLGSTYSMTEEQKDEQTFSNSGKWWASAWQYVTKYRELPNRHFQIYFDHYLKFIGLYKKVKNSVEQELIVPKRKTKIIVPSQVHNILFCLAHSCMNQLCYTSNLKEPGWKFI